MSTRVRRAGKLELLPAKVDAGVRMGMHTAGVRIASRARQIFTTFRPKGTASGETVRSITVGQVKVGGWGLLFGGTTYTLAIGPGAFQAKYLHAKTPPQRKPPIKRILRWLKFKPGTRGGSDSDLYPLAKAVQEKIARGGTEAFPFMSAALKLERDQVVDIIIKSVVRMVAK